LTTAQSGETTIEAFPRHLAAKRVLLRACFWVGSGLCGVTLLYLIGMNVFLRERFFRDAISFDPGSLSVRYVSAYSLLPGRIHVDGLTIRGRDSSVEWILTLDRCDFRVSFVDLIHHRFHAAHVRGDGLSLRLRERLDEVTRSVIALPPVPGFRDPPRTDVGPPEPLPTDENYKLWAVQLDDVVAEHVREIWIDTVRYGGDLTIRGRWLFRPLRWLEIGPAAIDVRSLDVSYGQLETWVSALRGSVEVTLHPLDIRDAAASAFLDHLSADADVRGTLRLDAAMNRLVGPSSAVEFEVASATAPADARLLIDHGLIRPGTRVGIDPFDVRLRAAQLSLGGRVEASLLVEARDGSAAGKASLRATSLSAVAHSTEVASAESFSTVVTGRELHLARLFSESSDASFSSDLVGAQTDALSYWQALVPAAGGFVVSGHARADVHAQGTVAQAALGHGGGTVSLAIDGLALHGPAFELATSARAHVTVRRDDDEVELSEGAASLQDVRASVSGAGKSVHLSVPLLLSSTKRVAVRGAGLRGDVSFDVPHAEIPDLAGLSSILPFPDGVTVDLGEANARTRVDLDLESGVARGHATLVVPNLKVHTGDQAMAGELRVEVEANARRSETDFSGTTMAFTSVAATGESDWWVRSRFDSARLSTGQGVHFRGLVSATAKDATPVGAFIAKESPVPRWLVDAVPTDRLRITGEVLAGPSAFEVRSLEARADGSSVDFEFGKLADWKEWVLLLDAGPVRAGLRAGDGGAQFVLFNAGPWFQEQTAALRVIETRGR
jgi:hypothetical protein